jgi:hypothetical protein
MRACTPECKFVTTGSSHRMEELRSRAFRVYLQHALSSAFMVDSVVKQRAPYLQNGTLKASAKWVRYCRNAQIPCGVLGLVAVDRVESSLQFWLQSDSCFDRANES